VEPEKQSLLEYGSEATFVSKQWLGKNVPAAKNTHSTIMVCWKRCFLIGLRKGVIRKTIGATMSVQYGSEEKRQLEGSRRSEGT
jgi:hypothetical protein